MITSVFSLNAEQKTGVITSYSIHYTKLYEEIEFSEYSTASEYEFHSKLYEITGNSTIIEFQNIIHPVLVFLNERFREHFLPINKSYNFV